MGDKWTVIEALRHNRHDWLNRLQLIKGNLSLGKMDRVDRVIEEIVQDIQQESKLSNLQLPELATTLLTHNWERHLFRIEYEIIDKEKPPLLDDKKLVHWLSCLFAELNGSALPIHDNQLYITMELSKESFRFFFHFNGIIENKDELESWLKREGHYPKHVSFKSINEAEFTIEAIFY